MTATVEAWEEPQSSAVAVRGTIGDAARVADTAAPALSFGVPVRNAERFLPRLLDSLLAQTLPDFEVVICDNASDDGTPSLCEAYARRDPRVRYHRNDADIGQIENFNRTLELARGRCFRWIGADDWLEPDYAERCLAALASRPDAIGVTTFQDHVEDGGRRDYAEYRGERLDSADVARRFARMMWAFTADYRFFDPIYSMVRREVLLRTHRLRIVPTTDQVLAAELILHGPFVHVPACLAHRRRELLHEGEEIYRRYHPGRHADLEPSAWRLLRAFTRIAWSTPMPWSHRFRCVPPVLRHVLRAWWFRTAIRARAALRPLRPLRPLRRLLKRAR